VAKTERSANAAMQSNASAGKPRKPSSGQAIPPGLIRALGLVKLAAARVNRRFKLLDERVAGGIEKAAAEVAANALDPHFPVDVFQTGSGTSSNMNANEVIANRASQILGGRVGDRAVHPNDHVNCGQSSNDVFPTAIRVAAVEAIERRLLPALERLREALEDKAAAFHDVLKVGRTHLQDAVPLRLWFLGNATWEHPDDLTGPLAPRPLPARRLAWATLLIQPCFWALVAAFLMEVNVGSVELRLDDLDLYPEETAGLAAAGVRRPGHLLRAASSPEGRVRVARAAGFTEERAASILARAELFSFKGIGARAGRLLERAGVRSVDEIAASSPEDLWERLLAAAEGEVRPLRLDMVRVWVLASRSRGIFSVAPRSAPPRPRRGRPRARRGL
jgi:hypothetical protein